MRIGMLWFDNGKDTLAQKVAKAADHYAVKHGKRPDTCHVHPSMLVDEPEWTDDEIQIVPSNYVLINHLWIGNNDAETLEKVSTND